MFIRIAAYHVQQNRLGLLAAEGDGDTNETREKEDEVLELKRLSDTAQEEDEIISKIKVF